MACDALHVCVLVCVRVCLCMCVCVSVCLNKCVIVFSLKIIFRALSLCFLTSLLFGPQLPQQCDLLVSGRPGTVFTFLVIFLAHFLSPIKADDLFKHKWNNIDYICQAV